MAISKFLLYVFGEIMGVGGGLVVLRRLSTIEKGTDPFHFQSNEPFLKFLQQLFRYEVPWTKKKIF